MKLETVEYDQAAAERELAGAGRSRQQKRREDAAPPAHGGNFHGHAAADEVRRSLRSIYVLRFGFLRRGAQLRCALRALRCACAAAARAHHAAAAQAAPQRSRRWRRQGPTPALAPQTRRCDAC
jgi:hypothetical protein